MADSLEVFPLALGPLGANCFIVVSGDQAFVVDPGDEAETIIGAFAELGFAPQAILVTHGHFDHFGAVTPLVERYDLPVYVGAEDAAQMLDPNLGPLAGFDVAPVAQERVIKMSGEQQLDLFVPVTAIPTPGHSRGSYTFVVADQLFSGDLIFQGSVGRTDLPGGSTDSLLNSIADLIRRFPPDTTVHCGHGPDTSLGRELALNPFLSPLRYDPGYHW
ncbi:MAG: MBL fold metallo-hydrolase [Thermoleophilia bacterium]